MAKGRVFYELLKFSSLGLEMGAAVVIGLLMGIFLDRRFGTNPWFTLLFLILGFAAGAKALLRAIRSGKFFEDLEEEE